MHEPAPAQDYVSSGLSAIGEVPWGTHICHIFGSGDDVGAALVPYFKAGLEAGERCIWIAAEPLAESAARRALAAQVPHLRELERAGQIMIHGPDSGYGATGTFKRRPSSARRWLEAEEEALALGYRGLRVSGQLSWPGRENLGALVDDEAAAHAALSGHRILALCSYSLAHCPLSALPEILAHHGFALVQMAKGWEVVHSATQLVDAIEAREDELARVLEPERHARRRKRSRRRRFGARRAGRETPSARLACLQRIALALSEVRSLDQLEGVLARDVRAVLRGADLVVTTSPSGDEELTPVACVGYAVPCDEAIPVDADHPAAEAYREGPLWLDDGEATAARYPAVAGARALAALPLRLAGRRLGAVVFAFREPRIFDGAVRALLWDIAYHMALTVDRALAYEDADQERRRAQVASESKDAFLAMLGHELRNPLAAIKNASDLMRLTDTPAKLERAHAVIARQTAHMTRLIDGLLDVSRIVRGKVSVAEEPLDLYEIVQEVVEGRTAQIERQSLALDLDLAKPCLWIRGDRVRITQIIDNLLSNAIDFTPTGGTLTIAARADAGMARIEVRDTGAGIAPDVLPQIFEPFQQASSEVPRTRGGLGLGLALVKGLVELHGGSVEASSGGRGQGASFTVRIPRCEPQRKRTPEAHHPQAAPHRVLIVEDHTDAAQILCDVLHEAGHQSVVARDGESAVETAREFQPDAVICDIDLPGAMSGHDVARAIRRADPQGRTLLVALSGYGRADDVDRAKAAGFEAHLTKPVDLDALNALLERHRQPGDTS